MNVLVHLLKCICLSLLVINVGCRNLDTKGSSAEANFQYITTGPGKVVLNYVTNKKRIPSSFEEALNEFDGMLSHRGDIDGKGLVFLKISDSRFVFVSFGGNNQYESGSNDDLVIVNDHGEWKIGSGDDIEFKNL